MLNITLSAKSAEGASQEPACHGECLKRHMKPDIATFMDAYE